MIFTLILTLLVSCTDITIENSLDPEQAREDVVPDLEPSCLSLGLVFLKELFLKKYQQRKKF